YVHPEWLQSGLATVCLQIEVVCTVEEVFRAASFARTACGVVRGYECRARVHRCAQSGETSQACLFSRKCPASLQGHRFMGLHRCFPLPLPGQAAIHVLGLPAAELTGTE